MPIEVVISPSPCLEFDAQPLPDSIRNWRSDLDFRSWWIVPTSRRRRQIVHGGAKAATLLPRVLTFDGLLQHLAGFSSNHRPLIGNTGRLLRIARAWSDTHPAAILTPGRVLQLDRIASESRLSGEPARPFYDRFARSFEKTLVTDGLVDQPGWIKLLAGEIASADGTLAGMIAKTCSIIFDGFHRFNNSEWSLIEALGKCANVRLWLVGGAVIPKSVNVTKSERVDCPAPGPIAHLGRTLFANDEHVSGIVPLEIIEATTFATEVDAVVAKIKEWKRTNEGNRLADIAVVVPDDSYISSLHNALANAGVACTPAAESFALADSRPARVLTVALRLVRHGWQPTALFDYLRQPLIRKSLEKGHLLEHLRQFSPRTTDHRSSEDWNRYWKEGIARYETAPLDDEDERGRDRDPQRRRERAAELRELITSIGKVLELLRILEKELKGKDVGKPRKLAGAIAQLLDAVGMNRWLSPATRSDWDLVPAREWEIDQLAFNNLKDVLEELAEMPVTALPQDSDGTIDVELILQLALAAENFQTSAEDDAGVQIVKARTIRGLQFKVVIAVGLVEGKVPVESADGLPDEEPNAAVDSLTRLAATRRASEAERDSIEQQYLFAQLFESAREKLILTRPQKNGDTPLMESPFLRRVKASLGIEKCELLPATTVYPNRAILFADRLPAEQLKHVKKMSDAREFWNESRQPDDKMHIRAWAMPLLALRYPLDKAFSATALERYASCPFQHFAAKTLGLDELERDDAAMRWGLLIHKVFEDFFDPNIPFDRATASPRFRQLLEDAWKKESSNLDATYKHDFDKVLGNAFISVCEHLHKAGFQQVAAEWDVENVRITDEQGRYILLFGQIDRVDRHTKANVEIICDFKTGKVSSGSKLLARISTGRSLQLPLYGLARQNQAGVKVTHGMYVMLSRKVKVNDSPEPIGPYLVHVGEEIKSNARTKIMFDPQAAGNLAVQLAHDIRDGRIPLTKFDAGHKDTACLAFCSSRHACRQPKGYNI